MKQWWTLYRLRRHTRDSRKTLLARQERDFRRLVAYAYEHSAYYKNAFARAGITKENIHTVPVEQFPVLDKQTWMEHFDAIVTVSDVTQEQLRRFDAKDNRKEHLFKNRYHVVHSSGSSGLPAYFLYDRHAWQQMLCGIIRGALWDMSFPAMIKLLLQKPRIAYLAATDGRYGGVMAVGDGITGLHAKQIQLDVNMPTKEWLKQLADFQPNVLIGYPSAVKILADLVQKQTISMQLQRVITCGEPLDKGLREYLEQTLQATVINFYGASESLAMGVERDSREGMYLFDDLNRIECINGKMYLTCLYNYAQPLIRYELTDSIQLAKPAHTAYPFSVMEGLLGRSEDLLWFTDKQGKTEFLHPLSIEGLCVKHLKDYQFVQTAPDAFLMYAERQSRRDETQIEQDVRTLLSSILKEKGLDFVRFQIQFVDIILPDAKTGKKKLILQQAEQSRVV